MKAERPVRTPVRNRLAKRLPERWREWLVARGVPKRKYTAVCRFVLDDGRVAETVVIEEGWIIATDLAVLADAFEQRIDFEPEDVTGIELLQIV